MGCVMIAIIESLNTSRLASKSIRPFGHWQTSIFAGHRSHPYMCSVSPPPSDGPDVNRDPRRRRHSAAVAIRDQEVRLGPNDPRGHLGGSRAGPGADAVELRSAA